MREFHPRFAAAYVCCIQNNTILLLRRKNTGFKDGQYTVPAGHIEPKERPAEAAIRELYEETNLIVAAEDMECKHVIHRISDSLNEGETELREYIDFFFVTRKWQGEHINTEPDKCDEIYWFTLDALPDTTIDYVQAAVQHIHNQVLLSEW